MTETKAPADELRQAAAELRKMAKNASRGPWHIGDCELYPRWILSDGEAPEGGYAEDVARIAEDEADAFRVSDADWHWMAFAHPGIAEPLASWLEDHVGIGGCICGRSASDFVCPALTVARVINGGTPR